MITPHAPDIYVVDDNNLVRAGIIFMLERENFVVRGFNQPQPFMAELLSTPTLPRLIISDYEMRGMNGVEIVQALKQTPTHQHVPVLIISAQINPEIQREATAAGAVGWVEKTTMVDDLIPAVWRHIL